MLLFIFVLNRKLFLFLSLGERLGLAIFPTCGSHKGKGMHITDVNEVRQFACGPISNFHYAHAYYKAVVSIIS